MNLITAIFNIITAPVAVIIKALVVTVVLSFTPLSTPSNLLIGCLALSDVLVTFTQQACSIHRRRTPPRKSVGIQSEKKHNGHGVCPLSTAGEVPWAKYGFLCNFCRPDKSVRHSEQERTMADPRAPRLPSKVSEHGKPAAWRPTRPDQTRRRPVGVLPQLQWSKAGFRPGTDSFQHLLQHDDKAGKWRPSGWGWRVCQVPPGRQPIQYTALSSSHQDSWEAYPGPSLRRWCCPDCPHRRYLRWSCMANSPPAIVTEGHLRNATKSASRSLSMCVT